MQVDKWANGGIVHGENSNTRFRSSLASLNTRFESDKMYTQERILHGKYGMENEISTHIKENNELDYVKRKN